MRRRTAWTRSLRAHAAARRAIRAQRLSYICVLSGRPARQQHTLSLAELAAKHGTLINLVTPAASGGLTEEEAAARLASAGRNELPAPPSVNLVLLFLSKARPDALSRARLSRSAHVATHAGSSEAGGARGVKRAVSRTSSWSLQRGAGAAGSRLRRCRAPLRAARGSAACRCLLWAALDASVIASYTSRPSHHSRAPRTAHPSRAVHRCFHGAPASGRR
jgi:hypothetical protein